MTDLPQQNRSSTPLIRKLIPGQQPHPADTPSTAAQPQQQLFSISCTLPAETKLTSSPLESSHDQDYIREIYEQTHEQIQKGTVTCSHFHDSSKTLEVYPTLFDGGATTNFIGRQLLGNLLRKGIVTSDLLIKLNEPLIITFADQQSEPCDSAFLMHISFKGVTAKLQFTLSRVMDPDLLVIGNGGMHRLNMPVPFPPIPAPTNAKHKTSLNSISTTTGNSVRQLTAYIDSIPSADGKSVKLMARIPTMENAHVDPIRVSLHRRSGNSAELLAVRMNRYLELGYTEECALADIAVLENVHLVDKKRAPDGTAPPWDFNSPDLHSRFRCTLSATTVNEMVLLEGPNGVFLVRKPEAAHPERQPVMASFFQPSARDSLALLPAKSLYQFAKIDLTDGFQSVLIHPHLRRFFGTQFWDSTVNRMRYIRWKTLAQGHRASSGMFRQAVEIALSSAQQDPRLAPHFLSGDLGIGNLQDDFLIAASSFSLCEQAKSILTEHLLQHSFSINPKKLVGPVDEINFCGWKLKSGTITPLPSRTKITETFVSTALEQLDKAKPGKQTLSWLRSLASLFQYFKGHLSGDEYAKIRTFHDLTIKYQELKTSRFTPEDKAIAAEALSSLANYVTNGLPPLAVGKHLMKDTVATIIITDANISAWSAILFHVIRLDSPPAPDDLSRRDDFTPLWDQLRRLPNLRLPEHYTLLPSRIEGGVWTTKLDKQRTSTIRERLAQYYAIYDLLPCLRGPVIMVSDNSNSRWDVAEPDITFQGAAMTKRLLFQQEVSYQIWLPRHSLPAIADLIARVLEHAQLSTEVASNTLASMTAQVEPNAEILNAIRAGYDHDTHSRYGSVTIRDIWQHLKRPESPVDSSVRQKAMFFKIGELGLLYHTARNNSHIVVPNVETDKFPIRDTRGPINLRGGLLFLTHSPCKVHTGTARSLAYATKTWWWPQIEHDVARFVASCHICVQTKARNQKIGTLSSIMDKATSPYEAWMMDHAGPSPSLMLQENMSWYSSTSSLASFATISAIASTQPLWLQVF